MSEPFVHESAELGHDVALGAGTSVWHLVQIRERADIGDECVIGRGAYIGPGVTIGRATKIQNHALIYDPAVLGSGVFIGPSVVLTNDVFPRSVDPNLNPKRAEGWDAVGVTIEDGASVGAGSVVLAGVTIGEWALVAAGATVIRDVPAYGLVAGNPAVWKAWVGRTGKRLIEVSPGWYECEQTGDRFEQQDGVLRRRDPVD